MYIQESVIFFPILTMLISGQNRLSSRPPPPRNCLTFVFAFARKEPNTILSFSLPRPPLRSPRRRRKIGKPVFSAVCRVNICPPSRGLDGSSRVPQEHNHPSASPIHDTPTPRTIISLDLITRQDPKNHGPISSQPTQSFIFTSSENE